MADGARCAIGRQQQEVVGSLLAAFPDAARQHAERRADAVPVLVVGPISDFVGDRVRVDPAAADLDPDWSGLQTDAVTEPPEN